MKPILIKILIFLSLIWAGMILGISFLEAPVKFTAPSLTLAVGLDVGRHVFGAFNKVELVFTLLLALCVFVGNARRIIIVYFFLIALLIILQRIWLMPVLDERALIIIAGGVPEGSSPHIWYVIFEFCKLLLLLLLGGYTMRTHKTI
jgi:hypothetical protein